MSALGNSIGRGAASAFVLAAVVLAGCAAKLPAPGEIHDPYEAENRETHDMNKRLDQAMFKEGSGGPPGPIGQAVSNLRNNLGLPRMVVNSTLQLRPEPAAKNTLRFAINTTLGIGGIFDPAGHWFGLTEETTDFGETLHVWGVGEGNYVELPVIGPSTERDAVGRFVDLLIDPALLLANGEEKAAILALRIAARSVDRKRYAATVNSILYDSADSYAQSRLLYLQNRRFELGGDAATEAELFDPYEDPYAE
ncbi:MlaA family lipoprotein [Pseudothioclava arenosa]|uniref:ABC transporter n=1 Tax=Pseudothioclava arenosa TaxID=1795308 RepID=A0A2A4CPW7_9RHOB|nr:VacJ family lipoprotein [Pseudothioclava arenosa]PCD76292.1 ABC transporter [Pseudothioclava arenosa]